ncbi:MAG TPA: sulfite oxidase [Beijerinckiaceae bacterium]|jgi:DMSO/TMAO reductase YedYZ molybdopterin-dependent catalytic subunit
MSGAAERFPDERSGHEDRGGALEDAPAEAVLRALRKEAGLRILGSRPLVAETPEHWLDDDTTPLHRFFVRNNGLTPSLATDPDRWRLVIDGEVREPLSLSLAELKERFPTRTHHMVLECAGNGRAFFQPPAKGNPWSNGGVGCAAWTGVPLAEVLAAAGVTERAVYTAHEGADPHTSDPDQLPLSRGVPIAKAMDPMNLLVFAMNGEPLNRAHGGPLRLVIPGWAGSVSHKWLTRITLRDREHDGPGMRGTSYRLPRTPMVPGGHADEAGFEVIGAMPIRSVITSPRAKARLPAGTRRLEVRGRAWGHESEVARVDLSLDLGQTWHETALGPRRNRYDWHRWSVALDLPSDGYFELWARAMDAEGRAQPFIPARWNPQGYAGNAIHRVAITVGEG